MRPGKGVDADKPPFAIGVGPADQTGQDMAAVYEDWDRHAPSVAQVWPAAVQVMGLAADSPYTRAGDKVAAALDAGIGSGIADGFHQTGHFLQVLANTVHLILRNDGPDRDDVVLSSPEKGMLLFAALIHDFHYVPLPDGTAPIPYQLEDRSLQHARPYLADQGVDPDALADIDVIVWGTNPVGGNFLRAAHEHLFEGLPRPEPAGIFARLSPVLDCPRLARMAALLADADILSSAGLTYEYSCHLTVRLGVEVKKPFGPKEKLTFLDRVVLNRFATPAGRFFQSNLESIRRTDLAAVAAGHTLYSMPPPLPSD